MTMNPHQQPAGMEQPLGSGESQQNSERVEQLLDGAADQVIESAGGRQAVDQLLRWAGDNLSDQELAEANQALQGSPDRALRMLNQLDQARGHQQTQQVQAAGGFTSASEAHQARRTLPPDEFKRRLAATPAHVLGRV